MLKPSKAQTEYWEKKLKGYGLAPIEESRTDHNFLVTLDLSEIDFDGRMVYHIDADKIGERLDNGEWPISLC